MNINDTMMIPAAGFAVMLYILWLILKRRNFAKNYPYEKKFLLTGTEYRFYKILKEQCDKNGLLICPKVRMEDFLHVTDRRNRNKYRGYIKSRHIDFILCDRELHMLAGLELDDSSHDTAAAAKTDAFKNNVFKKIEVPLYRIPAEPKLYRNRIDEMIRDLVRNRSC
ncbi:MAG: DUF2726 domain-containing protein [Lachnospiraceae bacterium]|nr:DUF2726 domain-containing protein [Lachnospiraceae bacterium]